MFKKRYAILMTLSLPILLSCTQEAPQASASSSFSSDSSISSQSSLEDTELQISLSTASVAAGTSFSQSCVATITYNGQAIAPTKQEVRKNGTTSWKGIDEVLTETGEYTYRATYTTKTSLLTGKATFNVVENEVTAATEGNGYSTISQENALKYRLQNVTYAGALGKGKTPSIGNVNVLVVPFAFKDGPEFSEQELSDIEAAYFGKASDTGWQSLASYYKTSSYGKLNFSGKVTSVYTTSSTQSSFQTYFEANNDIKAEELNAAVNNAIEVDGINVLDYDSDKDGYIDAVEFVYKTDRSKSDSDVWWNYTTYISNNAANVENPTAYRYFWSSISMINNGYYGKNIDAHTLVHETGHMLGLNDYYDYDQKTFPMGCADMMEFNIGDHNAYSKYLLGWVTPKVIDGKLDDFVITINDFASSGDCILLRDTSTDPHNGTPYDEYLMISYYTPTGTNEADSSGYKEWSKYGTGGTYNYRGLQILHVDERLYKTASNSYSYTDDALSGNAHQSSSNTQAYSYEVKNGSLVKGSSNKEVNIIPASGSSSLFMNSDGRKNLGSKDVLMGLTSYGCKYNGFSMSKMNSCFNSSFELNDGSFIKYDFYVSDQKDSEITIRFKLTEYLPEK